MFKDSTTTILKKLREAISKEDSNNLHSMTDNLVGSAATLGAVSFLEAIKVLEKASTRGNTSDTTKLLAAIEAEFGELKAETNKFLTALDI
ncbi:MAG: Hpt domain-containing protein [Thermodesulfobacteriota bacterium]